MTTPAPYLPGQLGREEGLEDLVFDLVGIPRPLSSL